MEFCHYLSFVIFFIDIISKGRVFAHSLNSTTELRNTLRMKESLETTLGNWKPDGPVANEKDLYPVKERFPRNFQHQQLENHVNRLSTGRTNATNPIYRRYTPSLAQLDVLERNYNFHEPNPVIPTFTYPKPVYTSSNTNTTRVYFPGRLLLFLFLVICKAAIFCLCKCKRKPNSDAVVNPPGSGALVIAPVPLTERERIHLAARSGVRPGETRLLVERLDDGTTFVTTIRSQQPVPPQPTKISPALEDLPPPSYSNAINNSESDPPPYSSLDKKEDPR